ncbi:hypothetical protein XENTR_v10016658 [Xenopus tropicalis]|nr:hypothetical protein XENTR_v10016658 [Xenopus tropicalis]
MKSKASGVFVCCHCFSCSNCSGERLKIQCISSFHFARISPCSNITLNFYSGFRFFYLLYKGCIVSRCKVLNHLIGQTTITTHNTCPACLFPYCMCYLLCFSVSLKSK